MTQATRFPFWYLPAALAGALLLAAMPSGCSRESEGPEYNEIEGTVSGIDGEGGAVRMRWYSPKRNETIELTGFLASDAEILIDGRTARLEDVQIEDRVVVVGRQEKVNGERRLVATRVEVRRHEAGASQPADPPPDAGAQPDAPEEPQESGEPAGQQQ